MNDKYWHKDVIKEFKENTYSNVFRRLDIRSDEKRITEKTVEGDIIQYDGFEIIDDKTKRTLFVTSRDVKNMPIIVHNTKKVVYARKIYHIITDCTHLNFERMAEDTMTVKTFIDEWFPIKHNSPDDVLVGKLLVLVNAITQSWCRLVTRQGFGKDGMINALLDLTNNGRKVSKVSMAKLAQLTEFDYSCFNELAGFTGDSLLNMQDFFLQTSDGNNTYEHSTTGSHKTQSICNISNYGYTICHNIPEYYLNKGLQPFEQMFSNAVFYRIFPVLLNGAICDDHQYLNVDYSFKEKANEADEYFKGWIKKFHHIKKTFSSERFKYDLSRHSLVVQEGETNSRWYSTFLNIAILVQMYSESDEEFYKIMDLVYDRNKAYVEMVKGECLI